MERLDLPGVMFYMTLGEYEELSELALHTQRSKESIARLVMLGLIHAVDPIGELTRIAKREAAQTLKQQAGENTHERLRAWIRDDVGFEADIDAYRYQEWSRRQDLDRATAGN